MTPLQNSKGRVLITGANGFIGSHLTEALVDRGYRVRCMVRRSSDLTHIRHLPVEWAYADVGQPESLAEACSGVDRVCHCAALTRALDEESFLRVNSRGTEALARVCLAVAPGLKRFLFLSSHAAAGPSSGPEDWLDESSSPTPITWYGQSKLSAEQALHAMAERLPITIVRPTAVMGPRDRDFVAYYRMVKLGLSLRLGRSERRVSCVHVSDLVALIVLALESDVAIGQTYFGCNRAYSYDDLSAAIAAALHRRTLRVTIPEPVLGAIAAWSRIQGRLTGRPALLNDQRTRDLKARYWLCSGEKARRDLGFAPQYDLDASVRDTAAWYQANGWL